MRSRGWAVVACALVVLASCNTELSIGKGTSTTTTAPTTTAPPKKTTTTQVRRPRATVVTRKQLPTTTMPVKVDPKILAVFDVTAADIMSLVLRPGSNWSTSSGGDDTGPVDVDRAAHNQALGDEEFATELREFLEEIGFLVGYGHGWEKHFEPGRVAPNDYSFLVVGLYFFSTPEGATANHEVLAEIFDEAEPGTLEPITVGDVPGSRAWTGGSEDDGYMALVQFAHENFFVQVLCTSSMRSGYDSRSDAAEAAKLQYEKLQGALEKLMQKYQQAP